MKYFLVYLGLYLPLLLAIFYWFSEEYQFTGKALSVGQLALLCVFIGYSSYCVWHGVDNIVENYKDHNYQMGRALSFTGMWTFVIPGLIASLIIFPRETLLYIFKSAQVSELKQTAVAAIGWFGLLLIIVRHLLVI